MSALLLAGCSGQSTPTVVVYTSQDQVYAEPILQQFERETGIRVRAVYDSEAVKTVGLSQRLLAEQPRPQCDVFWSNEEFRTRQLAARGVFQSANAWAPFGYRSRRIVINTNLLPVTQAPRGLLELTNEQWRGKVSLAYPLFGTTATHFLALRDRWGPASWEAWCRSLAANQPFLEEGNSHVCRRLARGEASIGLTDSDDLHAAQREDLFSGFVLPINGETLLIPNTVALIRNGPHPEEALKLYHYLQQPQVVARLVEVHALEGSQLPAPPNLQTAPLAPHWNAMLTNLEPSTATLKDVFLR